MATAKKAPKSSFRPAGPRGSRRWLKVMLALVVVAAFAAWYNRETVVSQAVTGTAYGARVACSCRFIGGRDLADCEKDFEPGMELVSLSEDEDARSVTASVPLLASQTATFKEGYGCVLEKWAG